MQRFCQCSRDPKDAVEALELIVVPSHGGDEYSGIKVLQWTTEGLPWKTEESEFGAGDDVQGKGEANPEAMTQKQDFLLCFPFMQFRSKEYWLVALTLG